MRHSHHPYHECRFSSKSGFQGVVCPGRKYQRTRWTRWYFLIIWKFNDLFSDFITQQMPGHVRDAQSSLFSASFWLNHLTSLITLRLFSLWSSVGIPRHVIRQSSFSRMAIYALLHGQNQCVWNKSRSSFLNKAIFLLERKFLLPASMSKNHFSSGFYRQGQTIDDWRSCFKNAFIGIYDRATNSGCYPRRRRPYPSVNGDKDHKTRTCKC